MAKYYTRHQSLKHIWYQRYNTRSSSRDDGVVPWYEQKAFKSDAWAAGCEAAWNQLMEERESLYNNENIAKAEIIDIETTKAGSAKLWVNVDNPYAEKWDCGDVNKVTIRKNKENLFMANYGKPEIGKVIFVTLEVYTRGGNTGFSYKIKYDKPNLGYNKKEGEKISSGFHYALDPDKVVQKVTVGCPVCREPMNFNVNITEPLGKFVKTCSKCGSEFDIDLSKSKPWICDVCGEEFRIKEEAEEHRKTTHKEEESEPSKYCEKCGNKLNNTANYCPKCGNKI